MSDFDKVVLTLVKLKEEAFLLTRVLYKLKNQQRNQKVFQYVKELKKMIAKVLVGSS
jgi:hypothetical protein